jgi:predicted transcriptional regulator
MSIDLDFLPDSSDLSSIPGVHTVPDSGHSTGSKYGGYVYTRKIDVDVAVQMRQEGKSLKEIAEHFGSSVSAVSQALSKATPPRPEVFNKLSPAQERFVYAIASGKNQTDAAMDSFNVTTRESAGVVGHRNAQDPIVQECIHLVMADEKLTRRVLVKRLVQHVHSSDATTSIKAVDMGFKLTDSYPATKSMSVNVNIDAVSPVDLSRYR